MGAVKDGRAVAEPDRAIPSGAAQMYDAMEPSGSEDPEPSSVTVSPSFTVWSGPASDVGARLEGGCCCGGGCWGGVGTFLTVMVTVSVSDSRPSETVSVNTYWVSDETKGAVNDGRAVSAPCRGMPAGSTVQWYDMASPLGSDEPVPSSLTAEPSFTVRSVPASAEGGMGSVRANCRSLPVPNREAPDAAMLMV